MDPNLPNLPEIPNIQDAPGRKILTRKNILAGIIVAIILITLPAVILLVQKQTQIKSKASLESVLVSGPNIRQTGDMPEVIDPNQPIEVELNAF